MTWSSSSPVVKTRAEAEVDVQAASWAWTELEAAPLGPAAEAARKVEEEDQHRREIEAAYRRGIADGEEAGAAIARKELQSAMHAILEALEAVRAQRVQFADGLRDDLVVLAAAIASKIIDEQVTADPRIFAGLANKAVAAFPVEEPVRVRLHPADLELLHRTGAVDDMTEDRSVRWMPDEETARGGCIVEGPDKIMDGRVDEAIRRIVRDLTDA